MRNVDAEDLKWTKEYIDRRVEIADADKDMNTTEVMGILDLLDSNVIGTVDAVLAAYKLGYLVGKGGAVHE